jgi:hypothetical protein
VSGNEAGSRGEDQAPSFPSSLMMSRFASGLVALCCPFFWQCVLLSHCPFLVHSFLGARVLSVHSESHPRAVGWLTNAKTCGNYIYAWNQVLTFKIHYFLIKKPPKLSFPCRK